MKRALLWPLFAAGLALTAQDSGGVFLELHQVTPAEGLRDANSRGGWGGMVGVQLPYARFVLEAGGVPTQSYNWEGTPVATTVATWGCGVDGILPLVDRRDGAIYLLGGIHLDKWSWDTFLHDTFSTQDSDSSAHLGLRVGAGIRAGRIFGELRYRVTEGDLRMPSYLQSRGGVWSAVEMGIGVRF